MIIQCEACQTRFRLAVEKVKPGGTKVRCSKCKSIFTVIPPAPEPVDEVVDFGAFNMERVAEDTPAEAAPVSESHGSSKPEAAAPQEGGYHDFKAFDDEMGSDAELDDKVADDLSFADTPLPAGDAAAETESASRDDDFSFDETPHPPGDETEPVAEHGESETVEFFADEASGPAEFSFDDEDDALAFNFDDTEEEPAPAANEDLREPGEFSFDDQMPFADEAGAEWKETKTADESAFDFEEPQFDSDSPAATGAAATAEEGGLHFGEIDFASDSEPGTAPGLQTDDDISKAGVDRQEESEPLSQKPQSTKQSTRDYDLDETIPTPRPQKKKSSLSRILVLLILLLAVLGGAAGYLYTQEGSLNLSAVARYLPFLQDYLGEAPTASPGDRIGINITGSSYVNGKAGQMLVIQGAAVNNHPTTRSAITIKGVLLDAQGKKLLQQTVFCGNRLDETALKSMPFTAIEEAMNNQFGDSLSNMNVAAGASIPFTIVFRNLPAGIANINVEVVDSKPGAG
jgi:predicted Zn finger-like uncharacterized protein